MQRMHPALAVEFTTAVLVIVAVLSVVLLVLIIVAPWRQVRDEPPLDKAVEAKLLLHRNPDEPTGEVPRVERGAARRRRRRPRWRPQRPRRAERPAGAPPDGASRVGSEDQSTAKNIRASQVVSPSTVARAWAQPPRALSRSTSTSSTQLVARTHDAPEAHLLDATEQRELPRVALVAEQRDRARLRERLELDHAGDDRVAGEVAGEEELVAGDAVSAPRCARRPRSRRPRRRSGTVAGAGAGRPARRSRDVAWASLSARGRTGCRQPLFTETIADYSRVTDVTRE